MPTPVRVPVDVRMLFRRSKTNSFASRMFLITFETLLVG